MLLHPLFTLNLLFCLVFSASSCFLHADQFEEIAKTLSEQVAIGIGALPKCSENMHTFRRQGDIEQALLIESRTHFLIRIRCSTLDQSGKLSPISIERRFFFKDFAPGGRYRLEANNTLLTLSIQDQPYIWSLGFRSSTEITRVSSLFNQLVALSEDTPKKEYTLSSMARKAGYNALVIAPKKPTIKEVVQVLANPREMDHMAVWLTKNSPDQEKSMLEEAENSLPFFVYELDKLDSCRFYTVSNPMENEFRWCTTGTEEPQSISSDDFLSLQSRFEASSQKNTPLYLHFTKKPSCHNPSALFHHPEEASLLPKLLKASNVSFASSSLHEVEPLFWNGQIPTGTVSFWLMPQGVHADDTLRYWFEKGKPPFSSILRALIREYPNLKPLLDQKSLLLKQGTVHDAILKSYLTLYEKPMSLPKEAMRVLKVVLLCHEMGNILGPREEMFDNSYPFAQMFAEKLAFSEQEQNMLELLMSSAVSAKDETASEKKSTFEQLFHESFFARSHDMSPFAWISLKAAYLDIIDSFEPNMPQGHSDLWILTQEFSRQTFSSLCFGLTPLQGGLPTRRLYSSYMWEQRDPLHRDGLRLKRMRERYEQHLLHYPQSPWKGKFWQWIDDKFSQRPMAPTLYLNEEQRSSYCPRIHEGKIFTHDGQPLAPKEFMFVIDRHERFYMGEKKDGTGPDDWSFNHASFTSAAPVASAGKITLNAEGKPILLRNSSGHFRPKIQETVLTLRLLQRLGVDIDHLQVEFSSDAIDKLPTMEGSRFLSLFEKKTS